MVKKAAEKLRKRSNDWEPTQKDLNILLNRLEETGQKHIKAIEPEAFEKVCEEYKKHYPGDAEDSISYKYFTLYNYLRHIFTKYRIEFFMWVSDPKWVFPVDRVLDTFLNTGYVPEKFKCSEGQGGFFKYVPGATIELIMMSRGTGKTTKWIGLRSMWEVVRHPTYKWLVVSSDKEMAKGLLTSIKEMMLSPYLGLIFPDLFTDDPAMFKRRSGNLLTREKINVVTYNEETEAEDKDGFANSEFRKEATFTIGSPQIDRTGLHFEGVFADDLVTNITSRTPKDTDQLMSFVRTLFAMKQYRDDHEFIMYMTGTEWWENSIYTKIKEDFPIATVFEVPAEWDWDGDTIRLCRYFTDAELANQKIQQGEWFPNQMMMQPRLFEGGQLDIGFSRERNVIEVTMDELLELKAGNLVAQICDPSFSKKGKKEGDKKSRFSIINSVVTDNCYMIYDAWQTFGMDTGGIKDVNISLALKNDIDFFVQDAQGQGQTGLYEEQIRLMRDKLRYLDHFKHEKSLGSKVDVANKVLSLTCEMKELVVLKIKDDPDLDRVKFIGTLIDQFFGVGGMDFVDCAVMMVADIDKLTDVHAARLRKKMKHNRNRSFKNISLRTPGMFGRLA